MELTHSLVETHAKRYQETQPLAAVEREHVEILPEMLAEGEFGWRDVEWVVQWYFRRYLGAYPDKQRREIEAAFNENTYEDILAALSSVSQTSDVAEQLERLRTLEGVDVRVASGFLQFMYPDKYIVVDDRVWEGLRAVDELAEPYPDPPSVADYLTYNDTCREIAEEVEVDAYTLYRALWQLGSES